MSDIVNERLATFVGCLALAFAVAVGGAGLYGFHAYQENKKTDALAQRAKEFLERESLRSISLGKFRKTDACTLLRPYGAEFAARKALGGAKVEGRICSAPDHESVYILKP